MKKCSFKKENMECKIQETNHVFAFEVEVFTQAINLANQTNNWIDEAYLSIPETWIATVSPPISIL